MSSSNATERDIYGMIRARAAAEPDRVILIDATRRLTWRQMLHRAVAYAEAVARISIAERAIVPVLVGRSAESLVMIVGCLLAGRPFSPVSLDQPAARLGACLEKMRCPFVLADPALKESLGDKVAGLAVLDVAPADDAAADRIAELPEFPVHNPSDLLYVLFTSGSTGQPKGVMVTHANIANTVLWAEDMLDWRRDDVIGLAVNLYFDIAMFDLFAGLCAGVPIAVLSEPANARRTCEEIGTMAVSSIFAAPVFFSQFVRAELLASPDLAPLRRIVSGGDFFAPAHVLRWLTARPHTAIYNVWGPTETSIVNTMHRVTQADVPRLTRGISPPVGRPHARMPFVLLDENLNRVDTPGEKGEICMQGPCVTAGYLDDPERTAAAYITVDGLPTFRTGDLGSLDAEGDLSIHGRIGTMIKVAGYRVDVGEVEGAAAGLPDVHAAAAFTHEVDVGLQELWLAVELKPGCAEIDLFSAKKHLRAVLPAYMVPKKIVVMDRLPTTPNLKIDRRAVADAFGS